MKRIKRTLAALLIVVLTLALLGEAVFADNSEQPVWPEEGAIQLSKSAAAVEGKENTWEVTLGIQGKNYKTTSDVVLVIDNSNSMYDNSRMAKTKAAANAFVDTLLTEDSTTRIALVVYNLNETHTGFYTYENKAALKHQIDAIAKSRPETLGGTFTQLGLHTARTLLNSAESTGQNKSIVLLSDGDDLPHSGEGNDVLAAVLHARKILNLQTIRFSLELPNTPLRISIGQLLKSIVTITRLTETARNLLPMLLPGWK